MVLVADVLKEVVDACTQVDTVFVDVGCTCRTHLDWDPHAREFKRKQWDYSAYWQSIFGERPFAVKLDRFHLIQRLKHGLNMARKLAPTFLKVVGEVVAQDDAEAVEIDLVNTFRAYEEHGYTDRPLFNSKMPLVFASFIGHVRGGCVQDTASVRAFQEKQQQRALEGKKVSLLQHSRLRRAVLFACRVVALAVQVLFSATVVLSFGNEYCETVRMMQSLPDSSVAKMPLPDAVKAKIKKATCFASVVEALREAGKAVYDSRIRREVCKLLPQAVKLRDGVSQFRLDQAVISLQKTASDRQLAGDISLFGAAAASSSSTFVGADDGGGELLDLDPNPFAGEDSDYDPDNDGGGRPVSKKATAAAKSSGQTASSSSSANNGKRSNAHPKSSSSTGFELFDEEKDWFQGEGDLIGDENAAPVFKKRKRESLKCSIRPEASRMGAQLSEQLGEQLALGEQPGGELELQEQEPRPKECICKICKKAPAQAPSTSDARPAKACAACSLRLDAWQQRNR
eukprot:g16158.t1